MITGDDVLDAARHARSALTPLLDTADWQQPAHQLEWSCRDTLDHVVNALVYYSANLARQAQHRPAYLRTGDKRQPPADLLDALESAAAVLRAPVRAADPGARGFHAAGMADAMGFAAMGCTEILVHTEDIAIALGSRYRGPDDLTDRTVRRLFPWAPPHPDAWERFRWCVGRDALPGYERQGPDWFWWCAPLEEWTGGMTIRKMPAG
jgi:uncharacterized protein (TIGR03083 family)